MSANTTYTSKLIPKARVLRKAMTPAERKLWFEALRNLPGHFRRQRPFGNYIADFYSAEAKLVIELDGESHNSSEAQILDTARTKYLESLGLRVLRFTNADVMKNLEGVVAQITATVSAATPLSATRTSPLHAGETGRQPAISDAVPPLRAGEVAAWPPEGSRAR